MVLTIVQSICFVLFVGGCSYIAFRGFRNVYLNIMLGRAAAYTDHPGERWKTMLMVALGQRKMFKRPIAAMLHLVIYVSFVITQVELIEIFIDGIFGTHRFLFHAWENIPSLRG
ncbi:MAG: Fe-S oxidoreductase, partial [Bacteroidetes bacterium]|nr:Fe-S oxidoreductase [Bacteroidota bacterium]